MEEEIQNAPPLTMNQTEIEQLIVAHAAIQEHIENEQKVNSIILLKLLILLCADLRRSPTGQVSFSNFANYHNYEIPFFFFFN